MTKGRSPIRWARWGPASRILARLIRPKTPCILILSMARSGSSWVGETLGRASNALYLREPVNQTRQARGHNDMQVSIDPAAPPAGFRAVADQAFSGLPNFPPYVVKFPSQWRLPERRQRRLVIKEVLPRAGAFFGHRFRPLLIFLVRHPAAVALSHIEREWWSPYRMSWFEMGAFQARNIREVQDALVNYPDSCIVQYENLCIDPLPCFAEIFRFADLSWDNGVEEHLAKTTTGGETIDPYSTSRLSHSMASAWTQRLSRAHAQELRDGYESVGLPWYRAPEDWIA